jgi:hypothetical protein
MHGQQNIKNTYTSLCDVISNKTAKFKPVHGVQFISKHTTFLVKRNVKIYLPMKEHGLKLLTPKSQYHHHHHNKSANVFQEK